MQSLRLSGTRGHFNFGWLDTRHSFSFGDYHDPERMGFRALRVINEDIIAGGGGFAEHGHANMEILTVVISGALQHQDSLGNGTVILPGEVQRMSAGTGIRHSEFNAAATEPVHLLQIWIIPSEKGGAPGYQQRHFEDVPGRFVRIASRSGQEGAVSLGQDAEVFRARMKGGEQLVHTAAAGRHLWLQVISGALEANGQPLTSGDGLALEDENRLSLTATAASDLLLFDLA